MRVVVGFEGLQTTFVCCMYARVCVCVRLCVCVCVCVCVLTESAVFCTHRVSVLAPVEGLLDTAAPATRERLAGDAAETSGELRMSVHVYVCIVKVLKFV